MYKEQQLRPWIENELAFRANREDIAIIRLIKTEERRVLFLRLTYKELDNYFYSAINSSISIVDNIIKSIMKIKHQLWQPNKNLIVLLPSDYIVRQKMSSNERLNHIEQLSLEEKILLRNHYINVAKITVNLAIQSMINSIKEK